MAHRLLTRFLPFLAWWPLTPLILRADLLAGVIGALVQVPKAMAYAQLAGLPLQYGLYAAFVPAIMGALWGSSRHLATGPVAVVSLMTSASLEPSYVLKAMGIGDELAHSSIRFGLGRFNTVEEVDYVVEKVVSVVQRLRDMSPLYEMAKEGIDLKSVQWTTH